MMKVGQTSLKSRKKSKIGSSPYYASQLLMTVHLKFMSHKVHCSGKGYQDIVNVTYQGYQDTTIEASVRTLSLTLSLGLDDQNHTLGRIWKHFQPLGTCPKKRSLPSEDLHEEDRKPELELLSKPL